MRRMIPLSIPNFEGKEQAYVDDAIQEGWVSTGGAYITKLEQGLADYLQVPQVAACQSGTSALHLALVDAGVGYEDVVLVPTLTFIAAVNPVKYQMAIPVFMDCDDSLCMDPVKLERFCTQECVFRDGVLYYKNHSVKALIVVHVFGNLADMEAILEVAGRYGIKVIEDATEALGTKYVAGKYAGKYAGTLGDYGAYSFNGNKIITTGGGGALTAREESRVEHMKYLSTQAKDDAHFYLHGEVGYNYRMTNVQAAIGVAQLEQLPEYIRRKQANYGLYRKGLAEFEGGSLLPFREGTDSNMWFYSLVLKRPSGSMREIIGELEARGVQTRPIWGLIHEQKPYMDNDTYDVEQAKYYSSHILNLPCSTQITEEEIVYVCEVIREVCKA